MGWADRCRIRLLAGELIDGFVDVDRAVRAIEAIALFDAALWVSGEGLAIDTDKLPRNDSKTLATWTLASTQNSDWSHGRLLVPITMKVTRAARNGFLAAQPPRSAWSQSIGPQLRC